MNLGKFIRLIQAHGLDRIGIADIGASKISPDYAPPYQPVLDSDMANFIGFEPNIEQYKRLEQHEHERYLPMAIGSGEEETLYITQHPGLVSTLKPDFDITKKLRGFLQNAKIKERQIVKTTRLDEVEEIGKIDLLKLDIQGGELKALRGGEQCLSSVLCIHTEVCFLGIYQNQPDFSEQHRFLAEKGFMLFSFFSQNRFSYRSSRVNELGRKAFRDERRQLIDGDALYIPSMDRWEKLESEALLKLIFIMVSCYRAFTLALHLLDILEALEPDYEPLREEILLLANAEK